MDHERFWSRVDKSGDCWLWTGPVRSYGAGQVPIRDKPSRSVSAHRYAWEIEHGPVPDGKIVIQTCGNPLCVRHVRLSDSRLTKVQARHIDNPLPVKPEIVTDFKWSLFERHVQGFESFDALAAEAGMPLTTVRTIVERISMQLIMPHLTRQSRTRYVLPEHPPAVSDRDWSIYRRHTVDGDTQAEIGRDLGISRERVRQIIQRVEQQIE